MEISQKFLVRYTEPTKVFSRFLIRKDSACPREHGRKLVNIYQFEPARFTPVQRDWMGQINSTKRCYGVTSLSGRETGWQNGSISAAFDTFHFGTSMIQTRWPSSSGFAERRPRHRSNPSLRACNSGILPRFRSSELGASKRRLIRAATRGVMEDLGSVPANPRHNTSLACVRVEVKNPFSHACRNEFIEDTIPKPAAWSSAEAARRGNKAERFFLFISTSFPLYFCLP